MNFKKVTAMLMAGIMSIGMLTGCNNKPLNAPVESTEDSAYQGEITMLFGTKDEFLSYLDQAAKSYASANGCTLNTIDCGESIDSQIEYVKAAVQEDAKVIMVITADNTRTQDLIDAAGEVPIVFVNRCPSDLSVLDDTHVYVGSDEEQSGAYLGEALVEALKKDGKKEINYIMLKGNEGHDSTEKRTEGVREALKAAGIAANCVAEEICNFDRTSALDAMNKIIAGGVNMDEVDCIISNNDAMALGAIEACVQDEVDLTGKYIVGVDGINDALRAIHDGKLLATVYQNATEQAGVSVQAAINLASGKSAMESTEYETENDGSIIWIPFEKITAENIGEYYK